MMTDSSRAFSRLNAVVSLMHCIDPELMDTYIDTNMSFAARSRSRSTEPVILHTAVVGEHGRRFQFKLGVYRGK